MLIMHMSAQRCTVWSVQSTRCCALGDVHDVIIICMHLLYILKMLMMNDDEEDDCA